ncbi:MAG: glycosyltransferase family 39 protein [Acidobacteriota bacterium]
MGETLNFGKRGRHWLVSLLLAVALAAGLYARLAGFGDRPLAVDEYYFAEGVDLILRHGVPRFEDGGYYVQGLLPQYLTAVAVKLLGETNTALRLPALLCGFLVPFTAFRYSRLHLPVQMAVLVSAALLLSSWEIEFSRFGRMYTALQCATLAFLYRFDRSIIGPDWKLRYRAHGWVVVATLCHLQGAILAPLLFLPGLRSDRSQRFPSRESALRYWSATVLVTVVAGGLAAFDFRRWGVANPFPPGYRPPEWSAIRFPQFVFWNPTGPPWATLAILFGLLILALLAGMILSQRGVLRAGPGGLALLLIAALLHQGSLVALLLVGLGLRYGIDGLRSVGKSNRLLLAIIGSVLCVWGAVAVLAGKAWIRLSGSGSYLGAIERTFFSWPDWTNSLIRPWADDIPLIGLLLLLSLAILLGSRAPAQWSEILRGPVGIVVYAFLSLALLRYYYESTRYSFFFYPVVLATLASAAVQLVGLQRAPLVFLACFLICGDFDLRHVVTTGDPVVAFRTGPFVDRRRLWYPRADYRGVARYLRGIAAKAPRDLFVIYYCPPIAREFQPQRYASYLSQSSYTFYEWSRAGGTRDIWEGRLLMSTPEELREVSRSDRQVWLARPVREGAELRPSDIWGERLERAEREFLSSDSQIEVLRVWLKKAES